MAPDHFTNPKVVIIDIAVTRIEQIKNAIVGTALLERQFVHPAKGAIWITFVEFHGVALTGHAPYNTVIMAHGPYALCLGGLEVAIPRPPAHLTALILFRQVIWTARNKQNDGERNIAYPCLLAYRKI
jgi:hypothetical protein